VEDYVNNIGFSERTDEVIEPKLSMQWFVRMGELAKPALDVVMDDTIRFYPENLKILTATGWKIAATGASAASYGGGKGYRYIIFPTEKW